MLKSYHVFIYIDEQAKKSYKRYVTIDVLCQAEYTWALREEFTSLYQFYHVTIMSWRLIEFYKDTWSLNKIICSLAICEWRMLCLQVKREYTCDVAEGFEVRCSITLTMQCWQCGAMPRLIYRANREPKSMLYSLHYIFVVFFGVFNFESNQHSEGVVCDMTMRKKMNEGDEGMEKCLIGSDM